MDMALSSPELMVAQALRAATDPNYEVVRKAEAQLTEWELQPGFFHTLARFCVSSEGVAGAGGESQTPQLDVNVRWMAAVYLKNGINKYWRRNARHELPAEEKQMIRELLLKHLAAEPVPQVALQVAVLVARIARIDCPRDWPELVPQLMKRLQLAAQSEPGGDALEQQRVLLVLHHVIKALASRRMMAEKRIFEELTGGIFGYMQELWDALTTLFFHQLKTSPGTAMATLERGLLAMRILRKLTIFGFSKPYKSECCMRFLEQLFARLKQCLECRYELQHLGAEEPLVALVEKFILKQMKTLTEFQHTHAGSFARFVPVALQFSFDHVFHEGARLIFTDNVINFRNFAIHCINLMKGIMLSSATAHAAAADAADEPELAPHIALADFFSNERLCYICEKIITHYFLLTQIELDLWSEDPEGFAQADGGESWKYALRPCVESFFLTCFSQYQAPMTAEVVKYIRKAQQIQLSPASDLKDILLKDAIYNAAGLASFHFFNDIDFDAWFSGQLLGELRIDTDNFRILRRRIISLVAEWAAVKFSRNLRPLAYEACLHLLRPTEDMSIRLAASRTLSALIGDFEFAPEPFLPYLEPAFGALFVLLGEAKECDTKMNVLTIMSCIVEKMSDHIEPQADNLIAYLPLLWKESEDYNMLRCAIICTLQHLVKAIRDIPETMKPFLHSVIQLSTDTQDPSHIYLIEEGLALWAAVVENSTAMSPQLMALCRNLLPIIEMSSENLRVVLILIQAYILLDAHAYLEAYGRQFVDFCTRMFDDIRPEGIALMLKVFETCLKTDAHYGLELVRPALPYIFRQVCLGKEFPMLMSMYLTMVARVLLISQPVFTTVLQELQLPNALERILSVWIANMPLVTELEKRKLFALAFASIFTNDPLLLRLFPGMMLNIKAALVDVMREEDDEPDPNESGSSAATVAVAAPAPAGEKVVRWCDSLVFLDEHDLDTSSYCIMDDFDYKTYHYDRCRQLALKDPVHKIVLPDYLEWQLNALRTQMGEEAYQQLMQAVDPLALEQIAQFVKLNLNFEPNAQATMA